MATKEAYRLTRVSVLGVPVSVFSLDDIDDVLSALLAGERFQQVVFISLWDLLRARRNRRFGQMVRDAAMVVPTSRSICRAARFLGKSQPEAYQPFEFVIRILGALERRGGTLYVLGLHRKSLQTADFNIRQTYPGLRLVGRHQGYFGHERESDIETAIRKASPDLLLAGSGVASGDRWLYEHRQQVGTGVRLWSKDVLDIIVGNRRRPGSGVSGLIGRMARTVVAKPWTVFRVLLVPWYVLLLLFYRLTRR